MIQVSQVNSTGMTRRDFLQGCTATAVILAGAGLFQGGAIDPATGQKQLMLMSPDQEISLDKQHSPFQFSSDYGVNRDNSLNRDRYMDHTAKRRSLKSMITKLQKADTLLAKEQYGKAESMLMGALRLKDNDYTAQVMTAKCMLVQKKHKKAVYHAGPWGLYCMPQAFARKSPDNLLPGLLP